MNPKIDHTVAYALIGSSVEGRGIRSDEDLLAGLRFKRGLLIGQMVGQMHYRSQQDLLEDVQEFTSQIGKLALLEKELVLGEHDYTTYKEWGLSDRPKIVVGSPRLAQWADPSRT
jgi:hypothetical protein